MSEANLHIVSNDLSFAVIDGAVHSTHTAKEQADYIGTTENESRVEPAHVRELSSETNFVVGGAIIAGLVVYAGVAGWFHNKKPKA